MVLSTYLEKIPLNLLHSFRELNRNAKKTEGIGREVLENRVDQGAFSSLTEGGPFPTCDFLVEIIYNAILEGFWRFRAKR